MLTEIDPSVVARLEQLVPEPSRGISIVSARHTRAALESALIRSLDAWNRLQSSVSPVVIEIDTRGNALRYGFVHNDVAAARAVEGELEEANLGVPVSVATADPRHDTHSSTGGSCANRDHCHTPLRSGVLLQRGGTSTGYYCTLGFHISINANGQLLTAGHCQFDVNVKSTQKWYHHGYGDVGAAGATLYDFSRTYPADIMYVTEYDAQASILFYGSGDPVTQAEWPSNGQPVCTSLGFTNGTDCGTVESYWARYISDTPSPDRYVWGGTTNGISSQNGDSGSPLYYTKSIQSDNYKVPIGLVTEEHGSFARVRDVFDDWNATIWGTCC